MDNEYYDLNTSDRDCLFAKCPYCGNRMVRGRIIGGVKKMKWVPYGEDLMFGLWSKNSIPLGDAGSLTSGSTMPAYYCEVCNKMILDLNYYTT